MKTMLVETLDSDSSVEKDDSEDNKRKLLISLLSDVDSEQSAGEKPLQSLEGEQEHHRRRKPKRNTRNEGRLSKRTAKACSETLLS